MLYFDLSDAAVDERERLQAAKSVNHVHVPEVLQDQLDGFYFVDFFHVALLEPVHSFLGHPNLTIKSMRAASGFFGAIFSLFSSFPLSI